MMITQNDKAAKKTSCFLAGALAAIAPLLLSGCGVAGQGDKGFVPTTITGTALRGNVHGGQQPVNGATIQLYAANTTGYGAASVPLISAVIKTDANGNFGITGAYTCPSADAQVYLTATGGNSGYTTDNPNLAMLSSLGSCGNLSASTFVFINELTTIGGVWGLSPFMTGFSKVSTSSTNTLGLQEAFQNATLLANTQAGTAPGVLPTGAAVSQAEIDTLADIIATCINSGGGTTGDGSGCGKLFAAANPGGTNSSAPTNTVDAAMNIAQYPALNVATLFPMAVPVSPYQPTLAAQPGDFTIAVNYTAGNLNTPSAIATDASGNLWIANAGNNTVTELSSTGLVLSGTGYTNLLNAPSAIAVANDGTVWVTNKNSNTVSRFSSSGLAYAAPYTGGGLSSPRSISFDASGTAWIANGGNSSVTSINSTGSTITGYTPAGASTPIGVVVNPN